MTPAIILRTTPVGESDLMVVLLTASHGRVDARANGARKSKRRFPGGLPMAARGFATLASGRGLPRLEGFDATHDAQALGRDLEAFAYAAYGCELAMELVEGALPDPRVFAALAEYLEEVSGDGAGHASGIPKALGRTPWAMRRFELRVLEALGFLAAFDRCAVCGVPLDGPSREARVPFDRGRGGPLCLRHGTAAARVDGWALHAADRLRSSAASGDAAKSEGEGTARELRLELRDASEAGRRALRDLVAGIVRAHLRRPLRSAEFFAQLHDPAKRAVPAAKGSLAPPPEVPPQAAGESIAAPCATGVDRASSSG